jgi:hypothetical protein
MKNELKHIAKSGFKIPDGYLDSLEDHILNQMHLEAKVQKGHNANFSIPDGYFDDFEDKVINSISRPEKTKVVNLNKRRFYYIAGVAASLIIMISVFIPQKKVTFDNIDIEIVEHFVETQHYNSNDFAELLTDNELEAYTNFDLSNDNLEDYLLENLTIQDLIIE